MNINTATAPAPEGHGSPDATGAAVTIPTTTERLEDARQAHAAAIENQPTAQERAERAATLHRQADADIKSLVDKAASAAPVDQTDISRAKTAVAEARDAADHASLVATGAGTLMHKAHVDALAAAATHLRGEYDRRVEERIEAAKAVDRQRVAFDAALETFNFTNLDISIAASAIRQHNTSINAHAATNKVLGGLEPSELPKARPPAEVPLRPAKVVFVVPNQVDLMEDKITSLEARERSLFGIVEPPAEPQPREESWMEHEARIKAEAEKMTGQGPKNFTPTAFNRTRTAR